MELYNTKKKQIDEKIIEMLIKLSDKDKNGMKIRIHNKTLGKGLSA
jgi:hypothetical protein